MSEHRKQQTGVVKQATFRDGTPDVGVVGLARLLTKLANEKEAEKTNRLRLRTQEEPK